MAVKDVDHGYRALIERAGMQGTIVVGIFEAEGQAKHDGTVKKGPESQAARRAADDPAAPPAAAATEEKKEEEPPTVLDVAIWNEFGTEDGHVPARSFIRAWFDENREKCMQAARAMAEAVLKGKYTAAQAQELLGQRFVAEIQKRMAAGIPPPNAPRTIKMKGSSKPLIDTGQLRSSITYLVKPSGDGEK